MACKGCGAPTGPETDPSPGAVRGLDGEYCAKCAAYHLVRRLTEEDFTRGTKGRGTTLRRLLARIPPRSVLPKALLALMILMSIFGLWYALRSSGAADANADAPRTARTAPSRAIRYRGELRLSALASHPKFKSSTKVFLVAPGGEPQLTRLEDEHPVRGVYRLRLVREGYRAMEFEIDLTHGLPRPPLDQIPIRYEPTEELTEPYRKGKEHLDKGRPDQAEPELTRVFKLDPEYEDIQAQMTRLRGMTEKLRQIQEPLYRFIDEAQGFLKRGDTERAARALADLDKLVRERQLAVPQDAELLRTRLAEMPAMHQAFARHLETLDLARARESIAALEKVTPLDERLKRYADAVAACAAGIGLIGRMDAARAERDPTRLDAIIQQGSLLDLFKEEFRRTAAGVAYRHVPVRAEADAARVDIDVRFEQREGDGPWQEVSRRTVTAEQERPGEWRISRYGTR